MSETMKPGPEVKFFPRGGEGISVRSATDLIRGEITVSDTFVRNTWGDHEADRYASMQGERRRASQMGTPECFYK